MVKGRTRIVRAAFVEALLQTSTTTVPKVRALWSRVNVLEWSQVSWICSGGGYFSGCCWCGSCGCRWFRGCGNFWQCITRVTKIIFSGLGQWSSTATQFTVTVSVVMVKGRTIIFRAAFVEALLQTITTTVPKVRALRSRVKVLEWPQVSLCCGKTCCTC